MGDTELDTIQITNLFVSEDYRGKGYGKKILEQAIGLYPHHYFTLDDMTDRSNHVYGNIYEQVGFTFVVPPTETFMEDGILKWKISGPERIKNPIL